ncbi:hypothetical protein ABT369_51595 [Dactylosporangium sp. NPDC000244]|uniref:hypothetical protein n=1 Tax=Dactylosporangium sp. NPDC000244 TaxID=3154365 RepID=UPI003331DFC4
MSTLEERLREEMARSVAGVRPAPDPYGRLLRRRRRGHWRWGGAGIGAVVVAALLGTQALTASSPNPAPSPTPTHATSGFRPTRPLSVWTRQMIAAPTRGDLAGDTDLVEQLGTALDDARTRLRIPAGFDRVKVLYLARAGDEWAWGAAFYNSDEALFHAASGPAGEPVRELVTRSRVISGGDLSEFMAVGLPGDYSVAFAPPGCDLEVAESSTVRPGGTVEHTWASHGGFTVLPASGHLWRVTCAGTVRAFAYRTFADPRHPVTPPPPVERGTADAETTAAALTSCPRVPGLEVRSWRVLWGGTPPGERRPTVVMLGMLGGLNEGAAEVCAVTGTGDPILVGYVHGEPPPAKIKDFPTARMTTALAASDALVVVRLPHDEDVALSDRLLVVAPPGATRLQVGGRDRLTLTGGVGVVEAPVPASLSIEAQDASGAVVARATVAEPVGAQWFTVGEPTFWNWD